MKFKRVGILAFVLAATSLCIMGASGGCGSDLHKASVAADSIANSLNSAAGINHQLIASGEETAVEGEQVAKYLDAAAKANDQFITEISQAEQGGGKIDAAAVVSAFAGVTSTVQTLQSQGVLGIKNPAAQAAFQTIITSINAEITVLQGLIQANTAGNRGAPLKHNAPLLGLALTAEEIEEIISIVAAAVGPASTLVEKLLAMKGETDAQLLADAGSQDASAEKQAEADEAPKS